MLVSTILLWRGLNTEPFQTTPCLASDKESLTTALAPWKALTILPRRL